MTSARAASPIVSNRRSATPVAAARGAIERIPTRFVRTVRHPAVDDLGREGVTFRSFDHVYDEATTIDDVYPAIVEALTEAARDHPLLGIPVSLVTLAYVAMTLIVPMWFLRILYRTHECINRPLSA